MRPPLRGRGGLGLLSPGGGGCASRAPPPYLRPCAIMSRFDRLSRILEFFDREQKYY